MIEPGETPNVAQFAMDAILQGYSGRGGLAAFREAGGHISSSTWFKLTGQLQADLAAREGIYNEPVDSIPVSSEIQTWTTAKARGFIHQVEVLARDKATGEVISIPFSVSSRTLLSRREVINQALDVYTGDNAGKYDQVVLGAVYTGTFEAKPGE